MYRFTLEDFNPDADGSASSIAPPIALQVRQVRKRIRGLLPERLTQTAFHLACGFYDRVLSDELSDREAVTADVFQETESNLDWAGDVEAELDAVRSVCRPLQHEVLTRDVLEADIISFEQAVRRLCEDSLLDDEDNVNLTDDGATETQADKWPFAGENPFDLIQYKPTPRQMAEVLALVASSYLGGVEEALIGDGEASETGEEDWQTALVDVGKASELAHLGELLFISHIPASEGTRPNAVCRHTREEFHIAIGNQIFRAARDGKKDLEGFYYLAHLLNATADGRLFLKAGALRQSLLNATMRAQNKFPDGDVVEEFEREQRTTSPDKEKWIAPSGKSIHWNAQADPEAVKLYESKCRELRADIEENSHNQTYVEELRAELKTYTDLLKSLVAPDGKLRHFRNDDESRADAAVGQAIKRACQAIEKENPFLGEHLKTHLADIHSGKPRYRQSPEFKWEVWISS